MTQSVVQRLSISIVKKQVVALTGCIMIGFLLAHLAGNFLIFMGPEWINGYAQPLKDMGPLLWIFRVVMLASLVSHVTLTILLTLENRAAREVRYEVHRDHGGTNFAKKTMIYTGLLVFLYITLHLFDFTITDHEQRGMVMTTGGEVSLGVYGMIWNAFSNPVHSLLYIAAMIVVGFHLSHAAESLFQTLGFTETGVMPTLTRFSRVLGVLVALGYSSIPLYILIRHHTIGLGVFP